MTAREDEGSMTAIKLSHPEKVLWPEAGKTKQDLLDHYEAVWKRMEPFVVNRPLSLVRAPDGIDSQRFFQKHASKGMNAAIHVTKDPDDGEEILSVTDFDGIAALVQMSVVEIHVWGCALDALDKPDVMIFDLDPDEGMGPDDVRVAALDVRKRLQARGLKPLVKTSGGKGFHVVAPLKPEADWAAVRDFSRDLVVSMQDEQPDRYTSKLSKAARKGLIFIDYLRNGRGATAVAPWSSRAKPGATVAVPISWEALDNGVGPADFAMGGKSFEKVLSEKDPWADYERMRVALPR